MRSLTCRGWLWGTWPPCHTTDQNQATHLTPGSTPVSYQVVWHPGPFPTWKRNRKNTTLRIKDPTRSVKVWFGSKGPLRNLQGQVTLQFGGSVLILREQWQDVKTYDVGRVAPSTSDPSFQTPPVWDWQTQTHLKSVENQLTGCWKGGLIGTSGSPMEQLWNLQSFLSSVHSPTELTFAPLRSPGTLQMHGARPTICTGPRAIGLAIACQPRPLRMID